MILEIIVEVFLIIFLKYPGGFIRWIVFRKRKLIDYCNDGADVNAFAIFIFIAFIILCYHFFKKYCTLS